MMVSKLLKILQQKFEIIRCVEDVVYNNATIRSGKSIRINIVLCINTTSNYFVAPIDYYLLVLRCVLYNSLHKNALITLTVTLKLDTYQF